MFKSILSARIEIVRLLLALAPLQRFLSIDGIERAINESATEEPLAARDVDITRAPIAPLKAAMTELVAPESLKFWAPDPAISTPGNVLAKLIADAFVLPQTKSESTPLTWIFGRNTDRALGSIETTAGAAINIF